MTSRNKSFYRHSGSTKKRQPHYKIIRKAAEEAPSRTAPSHPGAFQERLAFYLSEQEEQFASVLAGSGFSFDLVLGGERIGFRRKSDRYTDDTMENVETVFLAFPQNGDKKRLLQGCLITLHGKNLSPHDLESLGMMFHVTSDVERLGDHAENVADYTVQIGGAKLPTLFSEPAIEELHTIADKTMLVVEMAIEAYDQEKFDMLPAISDAEEEVDQLQETLIAHHIERLKNDQCDPQGGVIFTDLVTDLERCADHAINIAYAINGEKSTVAVKKYIITRGEEND